MLERKKKAKGERQRGALRKTGIGKTSSVPWAKRKMHGLEKSESTGTDFR